jgi:hypothetical protein
VIGVLIGDVRTVVARAVVVTLSVGTTGFDLVRRAAAAAWSGTVAGARVGSVVGRHLGLDGGDGYDESSFDLDLGACGRRGG